MPNCGGRYNFPSGLSFIRAPQYAGRGILTEIIKTVNNLLLKIFLILAAIIALSAGLYQGRPTSAATLDFALAWSSQSYIPPGYEGRALPTLGTRITISALPTQGAPNDNSVFYYRWFLDGNLMGLDGGLNKSSFVFYVTKLDGDSHEVQCQVMDPSNTTLLWRGWEVIRIVPAEVLLKAPASVYAAQKKILVPTNSQLQLAALPLFFHINSPSDVDFQWSFAGQQLAAIDDKTPEQFVLKVPAGTLSEPIDKALQAVIQHKTDPRQKALIDLTIEIK